MGPKYYGSDNKHVTLLPDDIEKASLFNLFQQLIFSPDFSQSDLLQHNIPVDKENKYLHRRMIILSIFILKFFKYIAVKLKKLGCIIEDFLNANIFRREKGESMKEDDRRYISVLGHMDSRIELNQDIKHGDARYYPALAMMASKLAYESELVIQTTISHHWKMEYVKFYSCYNEFEKTTTTQAFMMREETAEDDKIIVAFRGTSPFEADDWISDFDFSWCNIQGIGKIHKGFMIALGLQKYYHEDEEDPLGDYCGDFPEQIEQDPERPLAYYVIRDKLKEIMASNERAKFIVTGHSLGGAIAILFPAVLALHGEVELLHKLEAVYTYGQPRVGDKKFGLFMKTHLRAHNIKYYRIVYGYDIVPCVPLDNTLMTFKHFGASIHFNSLYHGKIVEEEQTKAAKNDEREIFLQKVWSMVRETVQLVTRCKLARLNAVWELIRGFMIGFTAGPYHTERWLLTGFRVIGIILPELVNHNPQDYLNATLLASHDLFNYYPAFTT